MSPPVQDRRFLLVLNPRAGVGSARYLKDLILSELGAVDLRVRELESGEEIYHIVQEGLSEGCTDIIAAGGDGTVSGAAGAIAGTSATLGILPAGTANMLARELGIPLSLTMAARLIRNGHNVVKIDALAGKERNFVYQIVIGSSSDAASKITRAEKRLFGRSVYALAGLRLLTDYRPIRLRATIDGREVRMWANQIIIANAGIMGLSPWRLGPNIRPDDGKVEIVALRGRTRIEFLDSGLDLMFGNYRRSKGLRYFIARREISLEADPPTMIKADGEFIGQTPITLKVLPASVRVYVPERQGRE